MVKADQNSLIGDFWSQEEIIKKRRRTQTGEIK